MDIRDLNDDDVVLIKDSQLQKCRDLIKGIKNSYLGGPSREWFDKGTEVELLKTTGGGWQKGKLYLRLEIVLDEPPANPNSLDELRRELGNQ